jgi:Ser/Thr protein kinase RdoA (MazF antagonist)
VFPPGFPSDIPPFIAGMEPQEAPGRHDVHNVSLLRMARRHAPIESVDMARIEMSTALLYWGYRPELWKIVGFTASAAERLYAASPVAHPIIEVMQTPVVVRRQFLGISERDIIARHAFMRYLTGQGLPVPSLLSRPDGSTYAMAPIVPLTDPQQASGFSYVLEDVIYEAQSYIPGRRFVTDGPAEDTYLAAAAQTLAQLHRASFDYPGPAHAWPDERGAPAVAQVYLARIADASHARRLPRPIATGLRRLAREGSRWVSDAARRLEERAALPRLHIHGDFQPHNLAFEADHVCAIYDFDAMHWEWRLMELAYALFTFTGLRWEDDSALPTPAPTPPLVTYGLDSDRVQAFLAAYGQLAPPQSGEAELLGDALLVALPVIFANAAAEDIVVADGEAPVVHAPRECREHLEWAETFPAWVEENRAFLRDAWA